MVANQALLKERMNALRDEFFAQLESRLEEIESAWSAYIGESGPDAQAEAVTQMHRMAHHLAGSGAIFGYPGVSEVAQALDTLLAPLAGSDDPPNEQTATQVRFLLDELHEAARFDVSDSVRDHFFTAAHFAKSRAAKSVVIVDEDRAQAAALAFGIREAGYRVRIFADIERLAGAFVLTPPDLLIMGTVFGCGFEAALATVGRVRESTPEVPIVVASGRRDHAIQLEALRGGASAFVSKSGNFIRVIDTLDRVLFGRSAARPRLLVCMSAGDRRRSLVSPLEEAGCYCETVEGLTGALSVIEDLAPDIAILDAEFADCTGLEAAIVLSGGRVDLPFLFVSQNGEQTDRLMSDGVPRSDIVSAPVDADIFTGVVIARVQAIRSYRRAGQPAYLIPPLTTTFVSAPCESVEPPAAAVADGEPAAAVADGEPAAAICENVERRVLIADDDPQLREAYRLMLEDMGYSVTTAADGLEAYDLATREEFDLLITDQLMPNCSGEKLIARLRAAPPTVDLPIIMVTMHRVDGETDRALAREVIGRRKALAYLEKPVTPEALVNVVERFFTPAHAAEEPIREAAATRA